MGKAEKKRLAAAALANAEILFDNVEDAELFRVGCDSCLKFSYFFSWIRVLLTISITLFIKI